MANVKDGKTLLGERIGVEFAKGPRDRRDDRGGRGDRYDDRRPYDRQPRYAKPRRTGFRAIVENLHPSASWQVRAF